MIQRLFVLLLLSIIVIGGSAAFRPAQSANPEPCAQNHEAWLKQVFEKMETIKPGMTRMDILKVFKTEGRLSKGGLTTGLRRTFISLDSPQFRVDVEFKPVNRPDIAGPVTLISPEDNRDIIVKISKPYLQFAVTE
jgi:hypothetical protein